MVSQFSRNFPQFSAIGFDPPPLTAIPPPLRYCSFTCISRVSPQGLFLWGTLFFAVKGANGNDTEEFFFCSDFCCSGALCFATWCPAACSGAFNMRSP